MGFLVDQFSVSGLLLKCHHVVTAPSCEENWVVHYMCSRFLYTLVLTHFICFIVILCQNRLGFQSCKSLTFATGMVTPRGYTCTHLAYLSTLVHVSGRGVEHLQQGHYPVTPSVRPGYKAAIAPHPTEAQAHPTSVGGYCGALLQGVIDHVHTVAALH